MNVFELQKVFFGYGENDALREVDLKIGKEGLAILGANGSGKSTLLSLLDCLIFPQKGRLLFSDLEVSEGAFSERNFSHFFRSRVGFMFQNPDVQLFSSTVEEELAFGPLQLDMGQEEIGRRIKEILELVGISHLSNRSPYDLSGGEKKKVAFASLLTSNPQILLLDEPTSNLDPRTKSWLADLLYELQRAGKIIIMATHDLDIAESVMRSAVIIGEDHRIIARGKTEEILSDRRLLTDANLIHEHVHVHGESAHAHGHGHFPGHKHGHDGLIKKDVCKENLKSHIADCFYHAKEMRMLMKGIPKRKFILDIEKMEKSLGRMAEMVEKKNHKK